MTRLTRNLLGSALATAATAAAGSLATNPGSAWYRTQDKPSWQPPAPVFPIAWTALYASIAGGSARAMTRGEEDGRSAEVTAYRRALGLNLALNAGWSIVFFGLHRRAPATIVAAALAASSADLARRASRLDTASGVALTPYAAWTAFATALTTDIARRNAGRP
jgi:tryptophan-rich sensory protein